MCENYVMHNITSEILNGTINITGLKVENSVCCSWSVLDNSEKIKKIYEYFNENNIKDEILLETILLKVKENKFNKNECVVYDDNSKKIINIPVFEEKEKSVKSYILSNKIHRV